MKIQNVRRRGASSRVFSAWDRTRWLLAGVSLLPLVLAAGAAEAAEPKSWHCTAYVRGSMGIRVIDYWSRGPSMVARTLIGGHPFTTIVHAGRYVVFDGLTGKGLDIARSKRAMREDRGRERPFAFEHETIERDGGEKIEDVSLGAEQGEIWQVTDGAGRRKLWLAKGPPTIPVRLQTFDRGSSETIDLDYQNWIFDLELTDDFFETPPGLDLETFEYDAYVAKSVEGPVGAAPILYPDLLHGNPPK